jgi:hypothetical protein
MSSRRLLLMSNSKNPAERYSEHAKDTIQNFLGQIEKALFLPYARVLPTFDDYTSMVREGFRSMGYEVDSVHEVADQGEAPRVGTTREGRCKCDEIVAPRDGLRARRAESPTRIGLASTTGPSSDRSSAPSGFGIASYASPGGFRNPEISRRESQPSLASVAFRCPPRPTLTQSDDAHGEHQQRKTRWRSHY